MEFVVNESGCRQLSTDMLSNMREIATLISEIDSQMEHLSQLWEMTTMPLPGQFVI